MVATAIGTIIILGVSAVTQSLTRTAERQKLESRSDESRARAVDLLRQDWRGRLGSPQRKGSLPLEEWWYYFFTTADAMGSDAPAAGIKVAWWISPKGLFRIEGKSEVMLVPGPLTLEFWNGTSWKAEPAPGTKAVRLRLMNPAETVVLR